MSYEKGYRITEANLRQFYNNAGAIYGIGGGDIGYGQSQLVYAWPLNESADNIISADHFNPLFSVVTACANHQGVAPNPAFGVNATQNLPIVASSTLADAIGTLYDNRFACSAKTTASSVVTTTMTNTWTQSISAVFTANFPTEDAARFFFNSGGTINLRFAHPNGISGPDIEWRYALSQSVGTVSFGAHSMTISGTAVPTVSGYGYYEIADDPIELMGLPDLKSNAPYTNDLVFLYVAAQRTNFAGVNFANGSGITFTVTLIDLANPYFLASGTNMVVDIVSPTDFPSIVPPTIALTSSLAPINTSSTSS